MIDLTFAIISAIAYGVAPIFYKPALQCTTQLRAMSVFSTYSILLGLLLPWKTLDIDGVLYAIVAGSIGGVFGSWLYLTSIKIGGSRGEYKQLYVYCTTASTLWEVVAVAERRTCTTGHRHSGFS